MLVALETAEAGLDTEDDGWALEQAPATHDFIKVAPQASTSEGRTLGAVHARIDEDYAEIWLDASAAVDRRRMDHGCGLRACSVGV